MRESTPKKSGLRRGIPILSHEVYTQNLVPVGGAGITINSVPGYNIPVYNIYGVHTHLHRCTLYTVGMVGVPIYMYIHTLPACTLYTVGMVVVLYTCTYTHCLHTVHCRYGGGPMVPKLEVCSVCKALLDEYADRRKREKEEVYKVYTVSSSSPLL